MDANGLRARLPFAAWLMAGVAFASAVVLALTRQTVVPPNSNGIEFRCGSMLASEAGWAQGRIDACAGPSGNRFVLVVLLLVVAVCLAVAAVILASPRHAELWRIMRWSAWPVTYFVAVTFAFLVTYPYVADASRRDDISGLEYLLQMAVAFPLIIAWVAVRASKVGLGWDNSALGSVVELYVVGLVQVGLVAWICRWGYRRSRRRSEQQVAAPVL